MKTIAIDEIPGRQPSARRYPYLEWVAMPIGQATEVELDGRNLTGVHSTIDSYFLKHRHYGMRVMQRQGHLYVARVAEDE